MLAAIKVQKSFVLPNGRVSTSLKGASLTVNDGEKVGVLGVSGAGKTTLARIICGLTPPDDGGVYLDGAPLYSVRGKYDRERGKAVQLVPQHPFNSLDPVWSVGDAVEEAVRVANRGIKRDEAKLRAAELLELVRLERDIAARKPSQISGGQAQRISIARALAVNPTAIIFDEATAMLDVSSQAQVISLLETLVREVGLSVLFISHDKELVHAFSDRIYTLSDGVLVETQK